MAGDKPVTKSSFPLHFRKDFLGLEEIAAADGLATAYFYAFENFLGKNKCKNVNE